MLISCGRDQSAYIINQTGKEITLKLELKDVTKDPTKYLIADALNGKDAANHQVDGIDNYFSGYDSLNQVLTLRMGIDEKMKLGTLRLDRSRDSIQDWEFHSFRAFADGLEIQARGEEIMNYIKKKPSFFSQNSHYLILK